MGQFKLAHLCIRTCFSAAYYRNLVPSLPPLVRSILALLRMMHGMNPVTHKTGVHVVFESEGWTHSFTLEMQVGLNLLRRFQHGTTLTVSIGRPVLASRPTTSRGHGHALTHDSHAPVFLLLGLVYCISSLTYWCFICWVVIRLLRSVLAP